MGSLHGLRSHSGAIDSSQAGPEDRPSSREPTCSLFAVVVGQDYVSTHGTGGAVDYLVGAEVMGTGGAGLGNRRDQGPDSPLLCHFRPCLLHFAVLC